MRKLPCYLFSGANTVCNALIGVTAGQAMTVTTSTHRGAMAMLLTLRTVLLLLLRRRNAIHNGKSLHPTK